MLSKLKKLTLPLTLFIYNMPMRVYATGGVDGVGGGALDSDKLGAGGKFNDSGKFEFNDKGSGFSDTITSIFGKDSFGIDANSIEAGTNLAMPFVRVINTFSIALYILVVYVFFGQTTIDLFYIFCPMVQGFMEKRAESKGFGEGKSGGSGCISRAAYEAVHGSGGSSGGLGSSSGERSYGSSIARYCGTRLGELAIFAFFTFIFLGGFIGDILVVLFGLLKPIYEALMNM